MTPPSRPNDPLLRPPLPAEPGAPSAPDAPELEQVETEPERCPRCGTPHAPAQEYCLECGLRLPVAHGVIPSLGAAWRRRVPWYPGDWIWPVLLGLVIAALGAAVAILASRERHSSAATTLIATTTISPTATQSTRTAPEPPTTTAPTTAPPPTATRPPPTTTAPPPAKVLTTWPAGKSGYTVILASLPASGGLKAARAKAREALDAGLRDVGVLDSSKFTSLHPGYNVVFSGVYATNAQAQTGAGRARAHYPGAYVRQIVS